MGKFILKRVLQTIPVLLGVILLVSALLAMAPGDPATTVIGVNATPDEIARFNALHGLDKPFFQRYFLYIYNFIAHGGAGHILYRQPKRSLSFAERIPRDPATGAAVNALHDCRRHPAGCYLRI